MQVGSTWIVRYNSQWARPRAPIVRLHEQQQLILQKHIFTANLKALILRLSFEIQS